MQSLITQFEHEAQMHRELAERALQDVIASAQSALDDLSRERVRTTVGGSVLNQQCWQDAERALVLYWAAASTAAILGQEADRR